MIVRPCLHVVVGLSGGVDSAVSAYLLQQQGYKVSGLFVTSWDSRNEVGQCTSEDEWKDVQRVCEVLKITCERKSFVSEYWVDVFEPLVSGYAKGETPNPDVLCNRKLKFQEMRKFVFGVLDADRFATGHYAQLDHDAKTDKQRLLQSPCDHDQTMFLSQVTSSQLENVMFPIGHLKKEQVRAIAREAGLHNAEKKSSTGICFVGKRNFGDWIGEYVALTSGRFLDTQGKVRGKHTGAERFTIGQRARVGGETRKWFVSAKTKDGDVILCEEREQVGSLEARDAVWVAEEAPAISPMLVQCRYRHTQPLQNAVMTLESPSLFKLEFERPQAGVAPGQAVAVYQDGLVCLGGGTIRSTAKWSKVGAQQ
jgi:tRNA-specific 2-thiouridylase